MAAEGTLSLLGGSGPDEGYLMIFHNRYISGELYANWGHVCLNRFDNTFDNNAAYVACRQMGYLDGEMVETDLKIDFKRMFLTEVHCKGQARGTQYHYVYIWHSKCSLPVAFKK